MIIGIDAGTRSMGIAALEDSGELRWSEQLAFKGALNDRLRALYGEIELLMESTYFAWVFIENPPYVQNQRTHATLHQAVGVVKAAVMVAGMVPPAGVRLLSATEIKAATKVQAAAYVPFGAAIAIGTLWALLLQYWVGTGSISDLPYF